MMGYNGIENGNGNGSQQFDWLHLIYQSNLFTSILSDLGHLPGNGQLKNLTHNPITKALADDPTFTDTMIERYGKDFNRTSLSKLATICQMLVFDNQKGPEKDNQPKALRRHWYAWYKTRFAQPFAHQLGDYKLANGVVVYNDLAWSQRLSQVYAWFVDKAHYTPDTCPDCGETSLQYWPGSEAECNYCDWTGTVETVTCTYKDLWVEDASRMMGRTHGELFKNANIVVAVEKDSLFGDFEQAAKSLGATCIISGKGKSSKAAIEKMLRDYFDWTAQPKRVYDYKLGDYRLADPVFTADKPMHVIHVSDHDYDGQAVIGPTFAEQVRRYTPHVLEARVGIKPEDLPAKGYDLEEKIYTVKLNNAGYKKWAREQALFLAECLDCGNATLTKGTTDYTDNRYTDNHNWPNSCQNCGGAFVAMKLTVTKLTTTERNRILLAGGNPDDEEEHADIAYGLEVEAMTVADYRDLLVKALLTILQFDYIVERIRLETLANDQYAAERVRDTMLEDNDSYQVLLADFKRLERKKLRFENAIMQSIWPVSAAQASAYPHQGDQPVQADYSRHVERAEWGAWNPFSIDTRTDWLVADMQEHTLTDLLEAWKLEHLEDYDLEDFDYLNVDWN